MAYQTQGELLSQIEVLTKGLRSNLPKLSVRGIDEACVANVETLRNQVVTYESEQETLKSRLKEKTVQVDETMGQLKAKVSEVRKIVKLVFPQTGWKEFGISDVK